MMMGDVFKKEIDAVLRDYGVAWMPPLRGWLAGGALTSIASGQKVNDLDLYFRNEADFLDAVEAMYDYGFWCTCFTERAITFVRDGDRVVQLMHFAYFQSQEEIFKSFDFTVCMAAVDLESKEFSAHPDFLKDVSKRALVFNEGTAFPICSGLRAKKYQDRGYTISQGEMLRILLACAALRMSSWNDVKTQLGGHYGEELNLLSDGLGGLGEFSPQKAITCFDRERPYFKPSRSDGPSSKEDVILRLAEIRGAKCLISVA